jgi:hypothetical protein
MLHLTDPALAHKTLVRHLCVKTEGQEFVSDYYIVDLSEACVASGFPQRQSFNLLASTSFRSDFELRPAICVRSPAAAVRPVAGFFFFDSGAGKIAPLGRNDAELIHFGATLRFCSALASKHRRRRLKSRGATSEATSATVDEMNNAAAWRVSGVEPETREIIDRHRRALSSGHPRRC